MREFLRAIYSPNSPARILSKELLRYIWKFVKNPTIKEIGNIKVKRSGLQAIHLIEFLGLFQNNEVT